MRTQSILTRADYEDYLVTLYFGLATDHLINCIDRAYLDFSRTLHGLRMVETKSDVHAQARSDLQAYFAGLRNPQAPPLDQASFDHWHQQVCQHLSMLYAEHSYHMFVGQAQKWINMTFKYIFTVGEQRLPGFRQLYQFCHVPLDNILLQRLQPYGPPQLLGRWSRLDNYPEYLAYQRWIRQQFSLLPLDVEFFLWLGRSL